ncbi:hypothetical protein B0T26DRAFT_756907 [Lasiosphaeria miniovina]|uniref:Uncharacterized protein n=1 Tax=Lasiosphaeria miniovina TaxID=1954250 RepID=A0AA39ZTH6_9PEZI|nr:uncharacterized protein B0T26DRAFT_756907 [Lasiosphaeria miniovina]KAK0703348.1 hypothetical protein B0T26DRAFT_756907 [Lasiosphaeria miniovina]
MAEPTSNDAIAVAHKKSHLLRSRDLLSRDLLSRKPTNPCLSFSPRTLGTDGNLAQAVCQAAYNGAVLVYARNHALAGARAKALEGTRDHAAAAAALVAAIDRAAGETAVLTCATDGTVVEALLAYPNRGRELLRNAQDYARRKSYELAGLLGVNVDWPPNSQLRSILTLVPEREKQK